MTEVSKLFMPFGLLDAKTTTWLSNLLTVDVSDDGYSRNLSFELKTEHKMVYWYLK